MAKYELESDKGYSIAPTKGARDRKPYKEVGTYSTLCYTYSFQAKSYEWLTDGLGNIIPIQNSIFLLL